MTSQKIYLEFNLQKAEHRYILASRLRSTYTGYQEIHSILSQSITLMSMMTAFERVGPLWSTMKLKLLPRVLSSSSTTDLEETFRSSYGRLCVSRTPTWARESFHRNEKELYQQMWWNTSGAFLAQLLSSAGYSIDAQSTALAFFLNHIIPYLGPTGRMAMISPWRSFMTDDGTPIEFSWDWTTRSAPPKIRYSIEPCNSPGQLGNSSDTSAAQFFRNLVAANIPDADFAWFDHFATLIAGQRTPNAKTEPPPNSTFYGFDCIDGSLVAKAYYILRSEKDIIGSVNWAEIAHVIYSAPQCSRDALPAMDTLDAFFCETSDHIDIEMLAVDLLKPQISRVKIYFRSRKTSFSSIEQIMTLNGRLRDNATTKGLQELRTLWYELFSVMNDEELPLVVHRTAGILYYVELKINNPTPSVKIYIPVRHYAASDEAVIASLGRYLCCRGTQEKFDCYVQLIKHTL